ncbi:MAG: Type 1 glutamine amidotransferase-like domain-containing protein [Pyrinomonadaceae bacterium]|nr:Type 1 glutamine amidotransferase-like domain-containing protein [Pyrinomonadaceae bacterium]
MNRKLTVVMLVLLMFAVAAEAKVTRYLTGNAADVQPVLTMATLNFGGGGTDVDPAIQWMINKARGCTDCAAKVDVVVLRATGSDGYNAPIYAMNGVDSIETLVITDRRDALKSAVVAAIQNAEVIFFAGGDQCNYVKNFKGTAIERAVESVYRRGGSIGGTSAGLAIQSEFVFDGCQGSTISAEALANPYHSTISFTYDFFAWNNLQTTLTETHFAQRDRMGRLLAFLARQIKDGRSATAFGIAVNEATSVVVDENGLARVLGSGAAYFVLADHAPETCAAGQPLTYSNYKIWKVSSNQTFDLRNRPTAGFYPISVTNGVLSGNPY